MATCNICEYAGRPSYKSPCSECRGYSKYKYKKMQTNADRFRSMSDEEQQKCVRRFWEIEDFADWLKQPAE